jgi:2',3'-cyclic-nucleotide 2'-phosphodiesterase (5'-nucleotidase family)
VVGTTGIELDARKARVAESSLGNLVADAARAAMGAQIALVQANLLRPQVLPAGDLTREALTGALLFPDERVVLVEISGRQIEDALEQSFSVLPRPSTGFLQVAGMRVTFQSKAKAGQRVAQVSVGEAALAADKAYRAAVPASLAKGTLGYYRIFEELKPKQQGPELGEAVCDHVRAARAVRPAGGRLRDLSAPDK